MYELVYELVYKLLYDELKDINSSNLIRHCNTNNLIPRVKAKARPIYSLHYHNKLQAIIWHII